MVSICTRRTYRYCLFNSSIIVGFFIFDKKRFEYFQNQLRKRSWFRYFWEFWALYAIIFVPLTGLFILNISGNVSVILVASSALIFARAIISPLIYLLCKKSRPYQKFNFVPKTFIFLSTTTKRHNAFPSDHVLSLAALSTATFFYFPIIAALGFILALLVGWGRIVLGYHDLIDVFGGLLIGILSGLLVSISIISYFT